jgi:17beta-estradiol 17-dehydrogenase / very-long-chain 3-oxoacyl-CoA reductase
MAADGSGGAGVLVNNVGVGNEDPLRAHEVSGKEHCAMIKVNCEGMTRMTAAVASHFMARKAPGRRAAILNISSGSSAQPSPFLATYGATKAYNKHFSKACAREYGADGIDVTCFHPYYVCGTGLYASTKPSLVAPAVHKAVKAGLDALGKGTEATFGVPAHSVMGWLFGTVFEDRVLGALAEKGGDLLGVNGSMLRIMQAARARMDRRAAKKNKAK